MRLALEIIVAALLIAFAWDIPFKERISEIPLIGENLTTYKARSRSFAPRPTPTVSGAWMWDPNRKTALDRPSPSPQPPHDSP